MRLKISFVFIRMLIFIGCVTRTVTKTQFRDFIENNDWENYIADYFDNMPEEKR